MRIHPSYPWHFPTLKDWRSFATLEIFIPSSASKLFNFYEPYFYMVTYFVLGIFNHVQNIIISKVRDFKIKLQMIKKRGLCFWKKEIIVWPWEVWNSYFFINTIVLDPLYIEVGIVHWNDLKRGTVDDPNSVCLFAQEGKVIQSYNNITMQ